jgi:hypothetical protein
LAATILPHSSLFINHVFHFVLTCYESLASKKTKRDGWFGHTTPRCSAMETTMEELNAARGTFTGMGISTVLWAVAALAVLI